jgi:hypothetical protein
LGFGWNLVGCCRWLPDLNHLQAQRLDPVQQAEERRLVLDRAIPHRVSTGSTVALRPSNPASTESLRRPLIRIS